MEWDSHQGGARGFVRLPSNQDQKCGRSVITVPATFGLGLKASAQTPISRYEPHSTPPDTAIYRRFA